MYGFASTHYWGPRASERARNLFTNWGMLAPETGEFIHGDKNDLAFLPYGLIIRVGEQPDPASNFYHPFVLQPLAHALLNGEIGPVLEILPWINPHPYSAFSVSEKMEKRLNKTGGRKNRYSGEISYDCWDPHSQNFGSFPYKGQDIHVLLDRGNLYLTNYIKDTFRRHAQHFATRSPQAVVFAPLRTMLHEAFPKGILEPPDQAGFKIFLNACHDEVLRYQSGTPSILTTRLVMADWCQKGVQDYVDQVAAFHVPRYVGAVHRREEAPKTVSSKNRLHEEPSRQTTMTDQNCFRVPLSPG